MAKIPIIVGTESGNAQMCADHLSDNLPALGHEVEVAGDADAGSADLDGRDVVLVCTATHGDGELPDSIILLAERLRVDTPALSYLRYGVSRLATRPTRRPSARPARTWMPCSPAAARARWESGSKSMPAPSRCPTKRR